LKTISLPSQQYSADTRTFDLPLNAQKKFIGVRAEFTRESWGAGLDYVVDGKTLPNTALAVRFLKSVDGSNWEVVGTSTFPGGVQTLRGETVNTNHIQFMFVDGQTGQPVAQDGDIRVELTNLIELTTAVTARMLEQGD